MATLRPYLTIFVDFAAAKIGEGILLDHGTGVVIGETAVVGNRVSLMHVSQLHPSALPFVNVTVNLDTFISM